MRELLRVCLLPFVLPNLIGRAAGGGELGSDDGGSTGSSVSSNTDAALVSDTTVATATSVTGAMGNATCLSRTANYITHTLPQQCLRTDRVVANATQNGTTSATTSANATSTHDHTTTVPASSLESEKSSSITTSPTTSDVSTTATPIPSAVTPDAETESDSPLDNANFLSFEEWKKQNLAKSGQSPENVGNARKIEGLRERPINNALESYGDEGEIDLDFSGFGGESHAPRSASRERQTAVTSVDAPTGELLPALRSKDAGKTCKERTNYASFDCAANVLKSNPECKSSSAVLVENKDSYMLNTCSANNKFFIVELCDDILIDTIVLANYEFFSSMFRHFRVSVSDRYPVKMDKWMDLGTFEARNVREVQAFLVERPQIWTRYLRIEFLSHYGSEYYCPVSLLRVHGTTMLEDYRHQEELARGDHAEEATLEVEVNATPALPQETANSVVEYIKEATAVTDTTAAQTTTTTSTYSLQETRTVYSSMSGVPAPTSPQNASALLLLDTLASMSHNLTCAADESSSSIEIASESESRTAGSSTTSLDAEQRNSATSTGSDSPPASVDSRPDSPPSVVLTGNAPVVLSETGQTKSPSSAPTASGENNSENSPQSTSSKNATSSELSSNSSTAISASSTPASSAETSRQQYASSTAVAATQPATQESFYKSVHKRLQQLESNSTLSLQYIEEQSRILRDAFSKVEKRQVAATTSFLTNLNSTVMAELHGFRQAYDQLWQSTVIELEGQREQYQREMLAMGARLTLVADELVWQKRMGIVQSTLLLLCLALVLFARQGGSSYLEMPLMQQMVHRSQSALARAGWESPPASPSPNSRSPVSLFRRKLWRSHTEPVGGSGDVTEAEESRPGSKDGLEVVVAPPTPRGGELANGVGGVGGESDGDGDEDGEEDEEAFEDVWESRSGPATPRGTREGSLGGGELEEGVGWLDPGASGAGVGFGEVQDR